MSEIEKLEKQIEKLKSKELKTREEIAEIEKKKKEAEAKVEETTTPPIEEEKEKSNIEKYHDKRKEEKEKETNIQTLTEQITKLTEEVADLKKKGISRKTPSKAVKTKEEDLPESVTYKIQKNMFEVDV